MNLKFDFISDGGCTREEQIALSLKRHLFPHGGREPKAFWICFSRVHPPSEIKSNFKFKTLKRHLLKRHLTLSETTVWKPWFTDPWILCVSVVFLVRLGVQKHYGKKKAHTALLQCRTFLCRKKIGGHRGKISVVEKVFLVFIGFLYPPPIWKVILRGQTSSPKDFLSVVVVYALFNLL